jgi:hypothetical protein
MIITTRFGLTVPDSFSSASSRSALISGSLIGDITNSHGSHLWDLRPSLRAGIGHMRPDACLHADQARRHIGQPCFDLTTRPLLTQHNSAAIIQADYVERVFTDINADHGNCAIEILGHGVLLVFGAPCQIRHWRGRSTAGPSH